MDNIGKSAGKNLAWLCGFINGDGSVTLSKQKMGRERVIYTPLLQLTNTDHSLIEDAKEILTSLEIGSYITQKVTKNGIAKTLVVKGFKRMEVLLPYLIQELHGHKKEQAVLLLEWINSRKETGNNYTYTEKEMKLFSDIK